MNRPIRNIKQPTLISDASEAQFYEFLVNDAPVAIYTCDKEGYLTFFNQAAAELWGRKPEIGKDLWCGSWKIFYPDGRPMLLDECPMARTLKEGRLFEGATIVIERPDHSFRTLLVFPRPVFDQENKLSGAHNTLVDITGKQTVEAKQAFLSAIVESSEDAIVSKNLNSIITSWNKGAQHIFGYTEAEALGKPITMIIPPSRLHEEDFILSKIRQDDKIDHFETIRVHKTGKEIPISLTVSPIKDGEGKIIGASKIARDISDRMEARRLLAEHSEKLEILNDLGKIISEKLDSENILQKVIEATTKITGAEFGAFFYNKVDENGESYTLFTLSGAPREAFERFGMPRNTEVFHPTFSGEGIVRSDDITKDTRYGKNAPHFGMPKGHLPVRSYLAVPVISNSRDVIGGLFFGHRESGIFKSSHESIVASIASQAAVALDNARLFEEVKMLSAKKDEFIALASHELKTPLTTVKGYLQILSQSTLPDPTRFAGKCLRQVERLHSLVEEMLDVSRIEAGKLQLRIQPFDLKQLIMDVIDNFSYTNKTHDIIFDPPDGTCFVKADKYRIEQVLVNLLSNAIKYSPNADKIYVRLEKNHASLTVRIKDEGIGLTPEQKSQLFRRFYRAVDAPNIVGLGLGLYLTREILLRHHGKIDVFSEEGKGSEFYFSLPLE